MELYGAVTETPNEDVQARPYEEKAIGVSPADTLTPADRYRELFFEVQMQCIFDDGKTFVDCVPRRHPELIMDAYHATRFLPEFNLHDFVHENFVAEEIPPDCFVSDPNKNLAQHIEALWKVLTRHPKEHPARSSLLPLPHDYVVPGGRFSELYYWDSYFTMLGFHGESRSHLIRSMADNFAYLIDTYGHVPNGNRTYYLSRSQPPVFSLMVDLFEDKGICNAMDYLPQLRKEYSFWMDGAEELRPGEAHRRCVCMPDGELMNRYWDDRDTPREESYREDVLTARRSDRPVHEVYRELRAGAESGWDFSSRWLDDPTDLSSIRTTAIVPIDLNSLLLKLEQQIALLSEAKGEDFAAADFYSRAAARCEAMSKYCWNESEGAYFDYDWQRAKQRDNLTAATTAPLFVKCASEAQAEKVAQVVRERLLAPGGISCTEVSGSGQQWDRPNGWAPLQWMSIRGLSHYGFDDLAREIRDHWLDIVAELYNKEGKLVEKYILRPTTEHARGGEYPLQDGFGWTNGVTFKLLQEAPAHQANHCRAISTLAAIAKSC